MNDTLVYELRASAEQTTGSETGTAANEGLIQYDEVYSEAVIVLDVTELATDTGDTLDVYIDVSFDGGTTWVNVAHFTQVLGDGSASKEVAILKLDPVVEDMYTVTADLAETSTRQIGLGTRMRYRGVVANTSTDDAAFTYSLNAFLK